MESANKPIRRAEASQAEAFVKIRAAKETDAPVIARFNQALAWETERLKLEPTTVLRGVRAVFRRPGLGRYFVAEINGRTAGQLFLTTEWSDWGNAEYWWIQSVYVEPDFRGGGVFKSLFSHVRSLAARGKRTKVRSVRLYVDRHNAKARLAYKRLGFRKSHYDIYEHV